MGRLVFGRPFEPADAEEGEHGGIAEGDHQGHGGVRGPGSRCHGGGDDRCYGTIGRVFNRFVDRIAQHTEVAEHSHHYKCEIDQAAGGRDRFGILDTSHDGLAQCEIDGAADDGGQEAREIADCRKGDVVVLITDDHADGGRQDDHYELDGEAATHDGPVGGGGYAKALKNLFFAVASDGVGVAHEPDGVEAERNGIGQDEGSAEMLHQAFPGDDNDDGQQDDHYGSPAVTPLGGEVGFEEGHEDGPGGGECPGCGKRYGGGGIECG